MVNIGVSVDNCYISCGCNRTPHAADWGFNGLICYGACHSVALYDPKAGGGGRVLTTLTGHRGRVNAVKWIKKIPFTPETELVSVSTDNCGLVWSQKNGIFVVTDVLKGHESSVTVVDAVYQLSTGDESTLVIVTASVDSTIRIWQRQHREAAICVQALSLDSTLCLSARLTQAHGTLLLACALDDCCIHLFTESNGAFTKQQVLKGHEDWITALDFVTEDGGDILLASGSQDSSVRLWRMSHAEAGVEKEIGLHVERRLIALGTFKLMISLESVLLGHDGRVYSVNWRQSLQSDSSANRPLRLLTASLDKTVVEWAPEEQSGVWLELSRMGEVGGNSLGFYGAVYGEEGSAILAHSYQGGLHMWRRRQEGWVPGVVVGGHFDAVSDLAWEPKHGRFVVSLSSDQTTRLHAPWVAEERSQDCSWHEIARPQVHGYDLVCLAMLPHFRFVSGADEKVVRAFAAPQNFLENFKRLCLKNNNEDESIDEKLILPTGAAVPVLGLSNKAVFQNEVYTPPTERHVKDQYDDSSYFTPQLLQEPPTEDNLIQNTLWPEVMKLYGHGYELFSLAATSDGRLLASACKATNEEHAAIILWDTSTWQKVGRLVAHQLTVTQMQFSPDDHFLLTVSRDRRWTVFQRSTTDTKEYKLIARTDKSNGIHSRIIWCCAWSHDSAHFATGSRDGKVVVWGGGGEPHPTLGSFTSASDHLDLPKESITAITFGADFMPSKEEYLIAIGSELGEIRLYGWNKKAQSPWMFLFQLSGNSTHHLAVKRLAFRPVSGKSGQPERSDKEELSKYVLQLASCGLDQCVRISDVYLPI